MKRTRRGLPKWILWSLVGGGAVTGARWVLADAGAQGQTVQAPRFVVETMWPKPLPEHRLLGSAVGLAVDSRDHVFVLNLTDSFTGRTETGADQTPPIGECCFPSRPVLEFDAAGNLVGQWGGPADGQVWPATSHGLAIDHEGNIWIGGRGGLDTRLQKFSRDGKLLQQVGEARAMPSGRAAGAAPADTAYQGVAPGRGQAGRGGGRGGRGGRGAPPPSLPPDSRSTTAFGGPAAVSFDPAASEAFVADGYRNRRVAVIDVKTGAIKRFWGAFANQPDDAAVNAPDRQFGTPVTCAELSSDGFVYVCDRSNNRIQVFRKDGSFVKEKAVMPATRGSGSVWDVTFSRDPQQRFLYVADGTNQKVHVLDRQSLEVLTSFGTPGRQPGQFFGVHSVATDSKGNLYTVEDGEGKRVQKFTFQGIGAVRREQGVVWPGR